MSSRIFDGFTRGFALSVLSVGFPNYETILCSHLYMTNSCYTERIKTVREERRTVEFWNNFAWISFIAFGEFLIHVNKFCDYKNSYLRSSFNTQQTCGENLPKFPYTYILLSRKFTTMQCVDSPCFGDIYCLVICSVSTSLFQDIYCHGMRFYILLQGYLCFALKRKLLKWSEAKNLKRSEKFEAKISEKKRKKRSEIL